MPTPNRLAKLILQVVPPSMMRIRSEMRANNPSNLTIPQFRIIANISHGRNTITEIAKHHGVSSPAMSKMVDGLVKKGLIERVESSEDRRQVALRLTTKGQALFKKIRRQTQLRLCTKIEKLSVADRKVLRAGLQQLAKVFRLGVMLMAASMTAFMPALAEAETLSWEGCVREAGTKNPDLQMAHATIDAAVYNTKAAKGNFLPDVTGNASYGYGSLGSSSGSSTGSVLIPTGNGTATSYSTSLTATQNVFNGLHDVGTMAQDRANETVAREGLETIRAKVSYTLKTAFAGMQYSQNALKLAQDIMRRRNNNLEVVQLRFENGRENKGSLLLSKAYLEQARYDELIAKDALRVAQEQLAGVLGRPNSRDIYIAGNPPMPRITEEKEVTRVVSATPDYRQAVAQKKAAAAAVTVARSAFFPTLDLNSTFGKQKNDWLNSSGRWSVGATVNLPFFNGWTDYYNTQSAKASLAAATSNETSVVHQMSVKLEQTYNVFVEATAKLRADRSFVEAGLVRAEIARERYNNGLLSFDDWDIIENDLINKQKTAVQSERDLIVSAAAWEQAQGIGVFR